LELSRNMNWLNGYALA